MTFKTELAEIEKEKILCKYDKELDLFVYQKLDEKERDKLSIFYLYFSKWWRNNWRRLSPKKRKEVNSKRKEIANCLLININDNPKLQELRKDIIKRSEK